MAEVQFGQTLIIGAGTSKKTSRTENGVPILKDIPLIKNLFNVENEWDQETSLLILIAPRKPARFNSAAAISSSSISMKICRWRGRRRSPARAA